MKDLPNAEEIYLRYIKEFDDKDIETLLLAYRDGLYMFLLNYVKCEEDNVSDLKKRKKYIRV